MDVRKTAPKMEWASRRRRRIACARQKAPESFRQISQTGAKAVGKRQDCMNSPASPVRRSCLRCERRAKAQNRPHRRFSVRRAARKAAVTFGMDMAESLPRSAARARGKGRIAFVGKGKAAPRRRKRLACTHLAFSLNGARLAPPLNKPKALQNKTPPKRMDGV